MSVFINVNKEYMQKRNRKVFINGVQYNVDNSSELSRLKTVIEKNGEKVIEHSMDNGIQKSKVQYNTDGYFQVRKPTTRSLVKVENKTKTVPENKEKINTKHEKILKDLMVLPDPKNKTFKKKERKVIARDRPRIRDLDGKHKKIEEDENVRALRVVRAVNQKSLDQSENKVQKRDELNKLRKKYVEEENDSEDDYDVQEKIPQKVLESDDYYEQKFNVSSNKWHIISLKLKDITRNGIMKILDGSKKMLFPLIKLPSNLYTAVKKPDNNRINDFRIYFKTGIKTKIAHICALGISFSFIKVQETSLDIVNKNVDLWRLRKMYDLELTNYYLVNLPPGNIHNQKKFMDRFRGDYELYRNSNYFDRVIPNLEIQLNKADRVVNDNNVTNVLYLMYSSIEYENYGYTVRTHYLLKNTNNEEYKVIGVTKYGYPYNRDKEYYGGKTPKDNYIQDDILYLKLLNGTDNFYDNNLIDFLTKYTTSVIQLAYKLNATVIHASSNFWNGIAAVYAAKYLGIKSVYEIRGFWDEATIALRPEVKNSDYLKMMINLEMKIIQEVDKVLTINKPLKDRLLEYKVPENKIEIVYNGVETDKYCPDEEIRINLRNKLEINKNDIVIGYIGTISEYEGLEYILECLRNLKDKNYKVRFILIGDGQYKDKILEIAKDLKIGNYFDYLGKMKVDEVIKYYNVFDIIAYPRKNNILCQSTSSYKVFEAMAMGKPIIVSNLSAYDEIITDEVTGLYCDTEDERSLETKLIKLIENKELREQLGNNARKWVKENREWQRIGEKMRDIYYDIQNKNVTEKNDEEKTKEDCEMEDCERCRAELSFDEENHLNQKKEQIRSSIKI